VWHVRDLLQGYLAYKKTRPPWDFRRALGIGLLWGPRGGRFLMSEALVTTLLLLRGEFCAEREFIDYKTSMITD